MFASLQCRFIQETAELPEVRKWLAKQIKCIYCLFVHTRSRLLSIGLCCGERGCVFFRIQIIGLQLTFTLFLSAANLIYIHT